MREWINFEEYWDYRMKPKPLDPGLEDIRMMDEEYEYLLDLDQTVLEYESMMSYLHEKYSKINPNITTEELEQILNEQY